uniref:uncharacterized protein LOC120347100 isoform X2 n=1 Tax=Styela clava TaxID=7725 RepID=UPI00193A42BE|nr:uncharacterized protein LOC120347100 isoform X2 [Styela clava]
MSNFKHLLLILLFAGYRICLNDAQSCSNCQTTILGKESMNITYGPSYDYNCQCDWTIPKRMDTDHETAFVLLLQNVSLPMTTGAGSTDCSGAIRFPSAIRHRCDFESNYCLVFATASTICNINKIREKTPVANHTCDSITPWNEVEGNPYKILYYAGNSAGYTKYFTIQYLVIDCRPTTTTPDPSLEKRSTARGDQTGESTNGITPKGQGQGSNATSSTTKAESNSTTIIIIVACIVALLVIGIAILLTLRYCKSKKPSPEEPVKLTEVKESNPDNEKEMVDNILYGTADDYRVPEKKEVNGNDDTDVAALYSVVQKNDAQQAKNTTSGGNNETMTVQEDPSCVYAVVQK